MNAKIVISVLTLSLVFASLTEVLTEGVSLGQISHELRCQCVNTHSKFIHPQYISVILIPSGPQCQNTEIIATLKDGREVCLDPQVYWVKLIIKRMFEKEEAVTESQL